MVGLPPLMEQVRTFIIDTIGCGIGGFERRSANSDAPLGCLDDTGSGRELLLGRAMHERIGARTGGPEGLQGRLGGDAALALRGVCLTPLGGVAIEKGGSPPPPSNRSPDFTC